MNEGKDILFETTEDGIGMVTINRPKALNALKYSMRDELIEYFTTIKDDDSKKAVIITGAGEKSFVVGADIKELEEEKTLIERKEIMMCAHYLFGLIENLGKPVIAAVNGFALGGGSELALACTLRIASENAMFGLPEIKLGIIPGYGGTQRLPRLVGKGRALEMILTGDPIDAQEAWRIGLVNKVVPLDKLIEEATSIAKTIMSRGPLAVKTAIEAVNRGMDMKLDQALEMEAESMVQVFATEDAREGLRAFIGKRKAVFKRK